MKLKLSSFQFKSWNVYYNSKDVGLYACPVMCNVSGWYPLDENIYHVYKKKIVKRIFNQS